MPSEPVTFDHDSGLSISPLQGGTGGEDAGLRSAAGAAPFDSERALPLAIAFCGCGKIASHKGMCSTRWAKRRAAYGPTGNAPKEWDFDRALVADRDRMHRLAMGLTRGDKPLSDDLVSQAQINILANRERFVVGSNFPAWCTTILKNCFFDSKRRAKNIVSIEQEDADGESFEIVDPALTVAPMQDRGMEARDTAREILALAPAQRDAMLRSGAGQSIAEIARTTDVSEGTVKSRISRGRAIAEGREARVIPTVSKQNADSLDFVLQKLREERDRVTAAITALEQCRVIFSGVR